MLAAVRSVFGLIGATMAAGGTMIALTSHGGVTALVVDDNEGDVIKWFLVGGTFAGFGFGVYHVLTRPEPTGALLEMDGDGLGLGIPALRLAPDGDAYSGQLQANMTIFSCGF